MGNMGHCHRGVKQDIKISLYVLSSAGFELPYNLVPIAIAARPQGDPPPGRNLATRVSTGWPNRSAAAANMSNVPTKSVRLWTAPSGRSIAARSRSFNVKTDYRARAATVAFSQYTT
jgi:hypothetical protein